MANIDRKGWLLLAVAILILLAGVIFTVYTSTPIFNAVSDDTPLDGATVQQGMVRVNVVNPDEVR